MSAYEGLSVAYDALMADGAYVKRAAWLTRVLRRDPAGVQTVLDLGCGTGTIACLLAREGFSVTASDLSEDMLSAARQKAEVLGGAAPFFIHQSMTKTRLAHPVDAVISTMDAVNYLTRRADLDAAFAGAYRALRPGGLFLFDVNTPYKLRRMNAQCYYDETDEAFCCWRTFFSEKTHICTYQVDLFTPLSAGTYERSYEEHRERAWEYSELLDALLAAGFVNCRMTKDMASSAPPDDADRVVFRARKPS